MSKLMRQHVVDRTSRRANQEWVHGQPSGRGHGRPSGRHRPQRDSAGFRRHVEPMDAVGDTMSDNFVRALAVPAANHPLDRGGVAERYPVDQKEASREPHPRCWFGCVADANAVLPPEVPVGFARYPSAFGCPWSELGEVALLLENPPSAETDLRMNLLQRRSLRGGHHQLAGGRHCDVECRPVGPSHVSFESLRAVVDCERAHVKRAFAIRSTSSRMPTSSSSVRVRPILASTTSHR